MPNSIHGATLRIVAVSRGLGARQREILDRLREIRRPRYAILWHRLHGDTNKPWPDPAYPGHGLSENGQPLCLYSPDSDRAVQVAYRRAANTLAARRLIEITYKHQRKSDVLYVRLPVTQAEQIAANGRNREYKARLSELEMIRRMGTSLPRSAAAKIPEHREWIWKFEHLDRGPDSVEKVWLRSSIRRAD